MKAGYTSFAFCLFIMTRALLTLLFIVSPFYLFAQSADTKKHKLKGTAYFSWGYNRNKFANTDIHFKNLSNNFNTETGRYDYYDFTLHDVKASDRPDQQNIFRTQLTIPQYNFRLGYFFNDKHDLGIEINFDHTKYIVDDYQKVRLTGQFNGRQVDTMMVLDPVKFLHFEHSDGANYLFFNGVKRFTFWQTKNKKYSASGVVKLGGGVVVPRTDVTLFGEQLNNKFHIAGWIVGAEAGARIQFLKYGFAEITGKGVIANYANVLVLGDGKANHYLKGVEAIVTLGVQYPF